MKKKSEAQRINYLENYDQFPTSLKNGKINLIYNIQGFEGVASGQIVITISKEKVRSNKVLVVDYENKKKQYIEQFDWHDESDEFKFRIDTSKEAKSILDKIFEKNDPTLKQLFPDDQN